MSATVHFYIRSERPNPDKSAQIYMLFYIDRHQKTKFSMHKDIPIKSQFNMLTEEEICAHDSKDRNELYCWDDQIERAIKPTPNFDRINRFLDGEKKRANDIILQYELLNVPLTVDSFRKLFRKPDGHFLFAEYYLDEFEARDNKWSPETIKSYKSIITKIDKFRPGITLNEINYKFLVEYENYMLKPIGDGGCENNERTVGNNMKILKTLLLIAENNGDYNKDHSPFKKYKIKDTSKELTTRDYLEPVEVAILESLYENYSPPEKALNEMSPNDWLLRRHDKQLTPGEHKTLQRFLFSCYTGLRFSDMLSLGKSTHLFCKEIDTPNSNEKIKKYYIEMPMQKTGGNVAIPLIDKAVALINVENEGKLLLPITNQKINEHLKSIEKLAELSKHLTFHVARHTFATICFLYGIDERIGQKLLGHKNRKFTEIYTHLSHNKIFAEMEKFNIGMNNNVTQNAVIPIHDKKTNELMTMINQLNPEKMEQLMGLLKLFVA